MKEIVLVIGEKFWKGEEVKGMEVKEGYKI